MQCCTCDACACVRVCVAGGRAGGSGRDVAIVSATPGTTRDVLEVSLNLSGLPVQVADTAGLRHTSDSIEREGIRRAQHRMRSADLKLAVFDSSLLLHPAPPPAALDLEEGVIDDNTIVVFNKADLLLPLTQQRASTASMSAASAGSGLELGLDVVPARLQALWSDTLHARAKQWFGPRSPAAVCLVSLLSPANRSSDASDASDLRPAAFGSGFGLQPLLSTLTSHISQRLLRLDDSAGSSGGSGGGSAVLITRERHRHHLQRCLQLIESFERKHRTARRRMRQSSRAAKG